MIVTLNGMGEPLMTGLQTKSDRAEKSAAVDSLFEAWTQGRRPGGAVGIFHKGEAVHRKGYGFANLSTGAEIDPQTPFRLASLTKPFVALAIMILEERGALNYDDPVVRYLPGFSSSEKVTLRHLLTHTSGVEDYEELFLQAGVIEAKYPTSSEAGPRGYEPSLQETVELLARQPLRFMPGDEWEYSNSGYVLLASVAEHVSGLPLARILQEHIFGPLGMHDSRLSEHAQPEAELNNRAKGYIFNEDAYTEADYSPLNAIYGPDGIYSTLDDMIRWCEALGSEKLVKSSTMKEAFTSGELNSGARAGYGFGWFIGTNFGLPAVSHTGSWMGYRSFLSYYPSQELGIVVLGNFGEFDDDVRSHLGNRLGKLYLGGGRVTSNRVNLEDNVLQRYAGKYEFQNGEFFEIELQQGVLWMKSAYSSSVLVPESKVKFFVDGAESDTYFFNEDMAGRVNGVTRHLSLYGYSKDAYSWARKLNT